MGTAQKVYGATLDMLEQQDEKIEALAVYNDDLKVSLDDAYVQIMEWDQRCTKADKRADRLHDTIRAKNTRIKELAGELNTAILKVTAKDVRIAKLVEELNNTRNMYNNQSVYVAQLEQNLKDDRRDADAAIAYWRRAATGDNER